MTQENQANEVQALTLEESIKDVLTQKLTDGTVEKLIAENLEKGINKALGDLLGSYGDLTKVIESKIKSVMVPYLETYDYSQYIVKLDDVLTQVLKLSTVANTDLLENFKELMIPPEKKEIEATELFRLWQNHVAERVETDGLEVEYDDGPSYEYVDVRMELILRDKPDWSSFQYGSLIFECPHDESLNVEIAVDHYDGRKDELWNMNYRNEKDIASIRYLNKFDILLMKMSQAGVKIIMDEESDEDSVRPEQEPEATFG